MPIVGTYVSLNNVFFEVVHAMKHIVVPTGEHEKLHFTTRLKARSYPSDGMGITS